MNKFLAVTMSLLLSVNTFGFNLNDTTHVLFIGNSITYFNNFPQIFEDISNSLGSATEASMFAYGGAYLEDHVVDTDLYALIKTGYWDQVVIQPGAYECGGESVGGTPVEITLSRIRILADSIYYYNPCCKILLYEISVGVTGTETEDIVAYNNTMDLIRTNIEYFSDSAQIAFAPVGESFRTSWNNDTEYFLWEGYIDIHPNYSGSYFAACTFYDAIFHKESFGAINTNPFYLVDSEYFQTISDTIVLNNINDWNINEFGQYCNFSYDLNDNFIIFENHSNNFDSLIWDFGDGTFSTEINPTHEYILNDEYIVRLKTYFQTCTDSISKEINLNNSSILSETYLSFELFPNPFTDVIRVYTNENSKYFIFDSKGVLKLGGILNSGINNMNLSNLSPGVYVFVLKNQNLSSFKKIVKY